MLRWTLLLVAGTLVAAATPAAPGRTIRWTLSTPEDFERGTLENVVVSSLGEIALGPSRVRVDSGELSVWCWAADPKTGRVYFGSGNEGKLLALTPEKKLEEVAKTGELVVTALTFAGGTLYAATIPSGKIFSFDPATSKLALVATLPDPYVWSLATSGTSIVAGTGPNGKLYRIDPTGKSELWFETRQGHVLSLAADPSGTLFAGTNPAGVLYRISSAGKGEIVFNTEEQEIRALVWNDQTLWIGANKSKKFDPKKFVKRLQAAAAQAQEGEEKESPFQDLFDGSVYRWTSKEPARLVHTFPKSYLTSLAVDKGGTVYVATGDEGKVWRLDADGNHTLLAKLKESQAMTLAVVKGDLAAIGTGNPGAVYSLATDGPRAGSFTSEIKDASFPAIWGTISWEATGPLAVQTRTGATAKPEDGTWSDWSEVSSSKIQSSAGRYFQFRVMWKSDASVVLKWVHVFYRTQNQKPQLKDVEVEGFDEKNAFVGKPRESGEVTVRWKGTDPDGDDLLYRLYVQRAGDSVWAPLVNEPLSKKDFKWDTSQMADGWYRVKIVAGDELTNPADAALTATAVTRPILIDNRKPQFDEVKNEETRVSGKVVDETGVVARIEYSIDGGSWRFLLPEDGLYDGSSERFTIRLDSGLPSGVHRLSIRAFDSAGNATVHQETLRR